MSRKKKVNRLIRNLEDNKENSIKEALLFLLRSDKSLLKRVNKEKELSDFSYRMMRN